jgi:cytochrome c oxidase assembly factor CtaG
MSGQELLGGLIQASPVYVVGAVFAVRARTLARQGRPLAGWRIGLFAAGLLGVLVAQLPPIGSESDQRLSVHMVQHLLIGDLAAFLLAVEIRETHRVHEHASSAIIRARKPLS